MKARKLPLIVVLLCITGHVSCKEESYVGRSFAGVKAFEKDETGIKQFTRPKKHRKVVPIKKRYVGRPFEGVKALEKPEISMGRFVRKRKPRKIKKQIKIKKKPSRKPQTLKKRKKITWNDVLGSRIMQKIRREKIKKLFQNAIQQVKKRNIEELQNMITQKWNYLKAIWHYTLTEEQRTILGKKLSKKQREEILETTMKKHINEIRDTLNSKEKNITEKQWEQAKKATRIVPNHDPFMTQAVKKSRKKVIRYAKKIDAIKDKIYSKNKKIKQDTWKKAVKAAKKIPGYRPKITQILQNEEKLKDIIETAKQIDEFINERFSKGEEDISLEENIGALMIFDKLPGYKDFIPKFLRSNVGF